MEARGALEDTPASLHCGERLSGISQNFDRVPMPAIQTVDLPAIPATESEIFCSKPKALMRIGL